MAVFMLLCLMFSSAAAATLQHGTDLQNTLQRMELLERKINALGLKDSKQESLLAKLNDINSEQTERINVLADENTLLKETVSKLKAQLDQLSDAPGRVAEEETRGSRHRRQLINTSYEGPVAFTALLPSHCQNNIGVNQNVVFSNMVTNLGGAYNTLHGVFMAPRAGVYLFSSSIMSDTIAHSTNVHAAIVLNGRIVGKMLAFSEANRHRDQGAQTVILDLKKGDQVWVKNIDNDDTTICGINGFTTFSGYMLYPY